MKNVKVGDVLIDTESRGYETCTVVKVFDDEHFEVQYEDGETTICMGVDTFVKATPANVKRYDRRVSLPKALGADVLALHGTTLNQCYNIRKQLYKLTPKQREELETTLEDIKDLLTDLRGYYKF